MKPIKLSDYFQVIRPEYVYLRLKPTTSIRNYNSDKIAKAVTAMHRNINQQFRRRGHTILFDEIPKTTYFIYIEKGKVEFYLIVPKLYLGLMKERITDTWNSITITEVNELPAFDNPISYYLTYTKEDALSLAVDRRNNDLLASTLNVIEVMEQGDKIGIIYNFIPCSQFTWRAEYDSTIQKIKQGQPVDRNKMSLSYISKATLMVILDALNILFDVLPDLFDKKEIAASADNILKINLTNLDAQKWSKATEQKKERQIIETQILVQSESKDDRRQINNAVSVCESFNSIADDNTMIYKRCRITKAVNMTNLRIRGIDTIKTSVDECSNFLALPGRELLEQHHCIEKVDTIETEVPEELRKGIVYIGKNTCKGKPSEAYLTSDKELGNLTVVIVGPTRAGKTTLFQNIVKNCIDNGECVVIPDFISWCKFSHEVREVIPKSKQLIIDCEDYNSLPGFGFNELWRDTPDPILKYDAAKNQTSQLLTLVDSINASDKSLSAKMDRYLEAAALIVFSQYGAVKDVFEVLKNHNVRNQYVQMVPPELKIYLQEYADTLLELDDTDRQGNVIGTRLSAVAGILDRVARLKRNTAMEIMLKNGCEGNINLLDELQKPQLIVIRMPDSRFATETEKDFMCTYWLSKLWLTLQLRDTLIKDRSKRTKVNMIWDELYQIPYTQGLLRDKLSQIAKFDAKNFISCHYLEQIGIIRDELKSANSSYMLLQGCDLDNYRELKKELYPFTEEDLLNIKRYHSLNLLKYEKGWAKFITQLPKPIN